MLNSLEQTLERIEGALASNAAMLDKLLERKRAPAQKRQSKAQVHDAAVASADKHFPMKGPMDEANA